MLFKKYPEFKADLQKALDALRIVRDKIKEVYVVNDKPEFNADEIKIYQGICESVARLNEDARRLTDPTIQILN